MPLARFLPHRLERFSVIAFIVFLELLLHAAYTTLNSSSTPSLPLRIRIGPRKYVPNWPFNTQLNEATNISSYPALFIFRRTKKTGSSSMMNSLMGLLEPMGYETLPHNKHELEVMVRNEFGQPNPRHLLVMHHNTITRNMHPMRSAVIADTVRDAFQQVTSYCRYIRKVHNCKGMEMVHCLSSNLSLSQNTYRWANRQQEDEDTYIDLPLSSEHPALSTSVLRTVYPGSGVLKVQRYNDKSKGCVKAEAEADVAEVFERNYGQLEEQVKRLRKRMLLIAGYSCEAERGIGIEEILDAAEELEMKKHGFGKEDVGQVHKGKSKRAVELLAMLFKWRRGENGALTLVQRRNNLSGLVDGDGDLQ